MPEQVEYLHNSLVATENIERSIERLRVIKREQKALKKQQVEEENIIKEYIGDDFEDLYDEQTNELLATYRPTTQTALDTKAFAAAYPKIFKKFQVERTSRRLLIK